MRIAKQRRSCIRLSGSNVGELRPATNLAVTGIGVYSGER